jgi:ABC-type xylose transport system permease subunit
MNHTEEEKKKIRPRPAFFDWFGVPLFIFVIVMTSWSLYSAQSLPIWFTIVLLIVSICGVFIDTRNVYATYFGKNSPLKKFK